MALRLATVTTLRDSADVVHSFIRYHRALGFDHIFLFFDDPDDPAYESVARLPDVTCWRTGPELLAAQRATVSYDWYAPHVAHEVMARQNLNADVAIARAREMGITWLLHLDMDELLHVPGHDARAFIAGVDADQIVFLNREAVPETEPVGDYFREVSLFKRNPSSFTARDWRDSFWYRRGWYFNGYEQGKAAIRVDTQPLAADPHRFLSHVKPRLRTSYQDEACILHFQTCGLARFLQKYRTLGRFPDLWYGKEPIPLTFHKGARDVVHDGDAEAAAAYYRTHVLLADTSIERELERGCLVRVELPAHLFA